MYMNKIFGTVYKITNTIDGNVYIGQTVKKVATRFNKHITTAMRSGGTHFYNAIRKYGPEAFTVSILEECDSKESLDEMEYHYIMQYDSYNNGYNLTLGGEGSFGYKHPKQIVDKMRTASLASFRHVNRGKHLSEEWKYKIALANKGKERTAAQRQAQSKEKLGKYRGAENVNSKKYVIINPEGDEFIIHGLCDFCRKYTPTSLSFRLLHKVAIGERTHHKHYKCRYYNSETDSHLNFWEAK